MVAMVRTRVVGRDEDKAALGHLMYALLGEVGGGVTGL